MSSGQKVTLILITLFLTFFVSMIVIIAINFRDYGIKDAQKRALLTADIVKGGLTAHMVNGMMDKRSYFLDQIENIDSIKSLWIVRSQTVVQQFGGGLNNEMARDDIDKEVLKSGKTKQHMTETATNSTMRISIPYIASAYGTPDCLSCHKAKEGEVLGVVSMDIDVSDVRSSSLVTIGYLVLFSVVIMMLVLIVVNKFLKPYMKIFYSIKDVMLSAYKGDYSKRVDGGNIKDSKIVADMLNTLLEKLQNVFTEIDKKVYIFLQNKNRIKDPDPLVNINNTIDQLSEIYKFKQTIEHDEDIEHIYERLAFIFKEKFQMKDFTLIESDRVSGANKVVYSTNGCTGCNCNVEDGICRADRINHVVDSTIFDNSCEKFTTPDLNYLCMPFSISNDLNLILSITTKSKDESLRIRDLMGLIEDYITTAQPAIVSKKLMQILNKVARIDQLTGMYNRKFLDEFADTTIPQAVRTNTPYGVLMIDIDFFKMINDTYGHDVGDEAIRVVSRIIKDSIRKSDTAIRFGGEEFIVMLHNCNKDDLKRVAEKIRVSFSEQAISSGVEKFSKTLSVGASMFPEDSDSIWKCIKFADISLYKAKNSGRNRVVCFDESLIEDEAVKEKLLNE